MTANYVIFGCISYLLGAIPFSYLLPRVLLGKDVTDLGSGNPGASNVARTCGIQYGLGALLLDTGKGAGAVLLVSAMNLPLWLGALAIIGHISSPFLGFSGGKGVATSVGVITVMSWQAGVAVVGLWLGTLAVFRYAAVSSIVGFAAAPGLLWLLGFRGHTFYLATSIFVLILITHRGNIRRLIRGQENTVT